MSNDTNDNAVDYDYWFRRLRDEVVPMGGPHLMGQSAAFMSFVDDIVESATRPTAAPEVDTTTTRLHKFVTDSEGTFCCRCGLKQGAPNQPCEDEFVLGGNAPAQARPVVDGELAAAARLVEAVKNEAVGIYFLSNVSLHYISNKGWVISGPKRRQERIFGALLDAALTALLGEREDG